MCEAKNGFCNYSFRSAYTQARIYVYFYYVSSVNHTFEISMTFDYILWWRTYADMRVFSENRPFVMQHLGIW